MSEVVVDVKEKRTEILSKMKEHHSAYNELVAELQTLDAPEKRRAFEAEQRKRLESFKKELTVWATKEGGEIDYSTIEADIFSQSNLDASVKGDGYSLGFDREGQPGLGVSYPGGGGFQPMAYDKVDAERYVKRQRRKEKYSQGK